MERVAIYLQQKSEVLSVQTKRYILIFFCVSFGGGSVGIIVHSATAKEQTPSLTKISKLPNSVQTEDQYLNPGGSITKIEYERVEQFKQYLFQLKNDSSGRSRFDSITRARPQLLDSIHLFEKIYLQQK